MQTIFTIITFKQSLVAVTNITCLLSTVKTYVNPSILSYVK